MQGSPIENRSSFLNFSKTAMQLTQISYAMSKDNLSDSASKLLDQVDKSLTKFLFQHGEESFDINQIRMNCRNEIEDALSKHTEIEFTKRQCILVILTAGMYALYSYIKHANDVNFVRSKLNHLDNNQSFSKKDIALLADMAVEFSVHHLNMDEEEARKEVRSNLESIFGGTVHNPDLKSFEQIKNFVPPHYFNESAVNLVELWYIRNINDDSAKDVRQNYLYHKIDKILNYGGEMTDKQIAERKGIFGKRAPLTEGEVRQNKVNSILNVLKEVYISENEGGVSDKEDEKKVEFCLFELETMFSKHEQLSLVNLIFDHFDEIRKTPLDPLENLSAYVNEDEDEYDVEANDQEQESTEEINSGNSLEDVD